MTEWIIVGIAVFAVIKMISGDDSDSGGSNPPSRDTGDSQKNTSGRKKKYNIPKAE